MLLTSASTPATDIYRRVPVLRCSARCRLSGCVHAGCIAHAHPQPATQLLGDRLNTPLCPPLLLLIAVLVWCSMRSVVMV